MFTTLTSDNTQLTLMVHFLSGCNVKDESHKMYQFLGFKIHSNVR